MVVSKMPVLAGKRPLTSYRMTIERGPKRDRTARTVQVEVVRGNLQRGSMAALERLFKKPAKA